jgi:hypothetical protein
VLHEVEWCLKCTFSHLITLKNQKDHQVKTNIANNVYTPLQTNKTVSHSTFETRLLSKIKFSTYVFNTDKTQF